MSVKITRIEFDGRGNRQEFTITATRAPFGHEEVPVDDLPQDVRDALLMWIGWPQHEGHRGAGEVERLRAALIKFDDAWSGDEAFADQIMREAGLK